MKKKIAIILLATILLTTCMATLCACHEEEPRDVKLELINPITGEIIKEGDTIDLPTERLKFEVRVKDKETGEYLTDDDIPENTIAGSCSGTIYGISKDGEQTPLWTYGKWPLIEDIQRGYDHYEVTMHFVYASDKLLSTPNFKRKYNDRYMSVRFYINK